MNITRAIITDLLPLYSSGECSQDTNQLVEEFLRTNPEMLDQVKRLSQSVLPESIPYRVTTEEEMRSLTKARRLIRLRSYLMGIAIFFSLLPFSFLYVQGKFYVLLIESPSSAVMYGVLALAAWIVYFWVKRKVMEV